MRFRPVRALSFLYISFVVLLVFYFKDSNDHEDTHKPPVLQKMENKPNDKEQRMADTVADSSHIHFGLGEKGEPVYFQKADLPPEYENIINEHIKRYDYNAFISDLIPINRQMKDVRPRECQQLKYPKNLPRISVVIPFRNERLSVLLRTVYSILQNSPVDLLAEIILVDDASDEFDLKHKLPIYLKALHNVQLIRKDENVGLMMARQAGIEASTTDYFLCMDSHMECTPGWLEPIVNRLVENPKALLCSNVGGIDSDNFQITFGRRFGQAFDFPFFAWNLEQEQARYNAAHQMSVTNHTHPLMLGSVMGMMIAMKKSWFNQLGGFDPGMKVWGSEQIEMSVKTWMCGGSVEMIPCSFVAHIFRRIVWDTSKVNKLNKYRFLETWVDEPYKKFIYDYNADVPESLNIGDIQSRRQIRESNQCHSFQYFIDKVKSFGNIHVPMDNRYAGELMNVGTKACMDRFGGPDRPTLRECHGVGGIQMFELTRTGEMRHLGQCVTVNDNNEVVFKHCDHFNEAKFKHWEYKEDETTLRYPVTNQCLTGVSTDGSLRLVISPCTSPPPPSQQWKWMEVPNK